MKKVLCVTVVLGLLSGCTNTPPTIGDPAPQLSDSRSEQAYQEILERYSDRGEIYDGFDTRMFGATTFQSMPFREARVRRLAQFQMLPPPRVEELLAKERAEAEQFHDFFLGVHLNDYHFDDFDQRDSIWRVVMLTPTTEVEATSITRVGRADLAMRALYPYLGVFWVAYRVRFPKAMAEGASVIPDSATHVHLRLASTLGHIELRVEAR